MPGTDDQIDISCSNVVLPLDSAACACRSCYYNSQLGNSPIHPQALHVFLVIYRREVGFRPEGSTCVQLCFQGSGGCTLGAPNRVAATAAAPRS